jgi:dihydroorotate dehydrogenase (NAD+) catalytic subunit
MAGASAIQIGTINFTNARAGSEIIEGIEEFMRQEGLENMKELVGTAF